jgi:hypothetical protein
MAQGALRRSAASIAIAVTGVLGPDPDEDNARQDWCSWRQRGPDSTRIIERRFFCKDPDEVRQCAIEASLKGLMNIARLVGSGAVHWTVGKPRRPLALRVALTAESYSHKRHARVPPSARSPDDPVNSDGLSAPDGSAQEWPSGH